MDRRFLIWWAGAALLAALAGGVAGYLVYRADAAIGQAQEASSLYPDAIGDSELIAATQYVTDLGLMRGLADGSFGVGKPLLRDQFARIVYRARDLDPVVLSQNKLLSGWGKGGKPKPTTTTTLPPPPTTTTTMPPTTTTVPPVTTTTEPPTTTTLPPTTSTTAPPVTTTTEPPTTTTEPPTTTTEPPTTTTTEPPTTTTTAPPTTTTTEPPVLPPVILDENGDTVYTYANGIDATGQTDVTAQLQQIFDTAQLLAPFTDLRFSILLCSQGVPTSQPVFKVSETLRIPANCTLWSFAQNSIIRSSASPVMLLDYPQTKPLAPWTTEKLGSTIWWLTLEGPGDGIRLVNQEDTSVWMCTFNTPGFGVDVADSYGLCIRDLYGVTVRVRNSQDITFMGDSGLTIDSDEISDYYEMP